jgi:Histidine kinase
MLWPLQNKSQTSYWLKVFALYALTEACIQLLFLFILNTFGGNRISIIEFHFIMLVFQCIFIIPIWWVAWFVRSRKIIVQVVVNIAFYIVYSFIWFGPVQDAIGYLYNNLQEITRSVADRQVPHLDRGYEYSYLNYQLLKHAFRLSWFYLANYFYNYQQEEKKRIELAVFNKELQLKLLKWHLNPSFYFKTINYLQQSAAVQPSNATEPILQLAKVMEYVIYEAREPQIEMKKEIQFLSNYIQLTNLQAENNMHIELEYEEGYEKLKIAPLLLAGLVDNIVSSVKGTERTNCTIKMEFYKSEMNFSVNGIVGKLVTPPLLNELYKGRFSEEYSPAKQYTLQIQLDEA